MIDRLRVTTAERNLLIRIRDSEDGELVYEKGAGWWVGYDRVSAQVVHGLLNKVLIRDTDNTAGVLEIYELNEEGEQAAVDPSYVPSIGKLLDR